jgi:uncharacterized damage-inducible protein DinB
MKTNSTIANRFREVMLNGTWIANTNFKDQLSDVSFKLANYKIENLNTIGVLAQHIHYYIAGINNVFEGGTLDIRDKYSFDFPPIASQKDWEYILSTLWNDAEKFANFVEQLPENKLIEHFVEEKFGTYQRNIDGMIEHCYYHLGQITLLKKMITASNNNNS